MENYIIALYHNLLGSQFELGRGGTTLPAATDYAATALPDRIPVAASLTITLNLFDDQVRTKYHDLTSCSGTLYALPNGSGGSPVTLAAGSLSGVTPASGQMKFTVAKDLILEAWASYDSVRFWFEITETAAPDSKIILWQDVIIDSMLAPDEVDYPDSSEIAITYTDVAVTGALTALKGLQIVRINTTAAPVVLTLHAANHANAGEIIVVHDAGGNAASVALAGSDTINGHAGPIVITGVGTGLLLIPNTAKTGFTAFNYDLAVE